MAQIFYVHCPACGGKFPCHPELWEVDYDLLCPFCQLSFPQAQSPLIITGTGERRRGPGALPTGSAPPPRAAAGAARPSRADQEPSRGDEDPSAGAESM